MQSNVGVSLRMLYYVAEMAHGYKIQKTDLQLQSICMHVVTKKKKICNTELKDLKFRTMDLQV